MSHAALLAKAAAIGALMLPHHGHAKAQVPTCKLTADTPVGVVVRDKEAYQVAANLDCGLQNVPNDVVLCAQEKVNGTWQLVPPPSPSWPACSVSGWATSSSTGMTNQFFATPGVTYRTLAVYWSKIGGMTQSGEATSSTWTG